MILICHSAKPRYHYFMDTKSDQSVTQRKHTKLIKIIELKDSETRQTSKEQTLTQRIVFEVAWPLLPTPLTVHKSFHICQENDQLKYKMLCRLIKPSLYQINVNTIFFVK